MTAHDREEAVLDALGVRGFAPPGVDDPLRDFMATYFDHDDEVTRGMVLGYISRILARYLSTDTGEGLREALRAFMESPHNAGHDGHVDGFCRRCADIYEAGARALSTGAPGLDAAWAAAEAALPLQGWASQDGRWVLPGAGRRIELRWIDEGDGYFEPHFDGWLATARVDAYGAPAFERDSGPLEPTPAAALRSLAARLASPGEP